MKKGKASVQPSTSTRDKGVPMSPNMQSKKVKPNSSTFKKVDASMKKVKSTTQLPESIFIDIRKRHPDTSSAVLTKQGVVLHNDMVEGQSKRHQNNSSPKTTDTESDTGRKSDSFIGPKGKGFPKKSRYYKTQKRSNKCDANKPDHPPDVFPDQGVKRKSNESDASDAKTQCKRSKMFFSDNDGTPIKPTQRVYDPSKIGSTPRKRKTSGTNVRQEGSKKKKQNQDKTDTPLKENNVEAFQSDRQDVNKGYYDRKRKKKLSPEEKAEKQKQAKKKDKTEM